RGVRVAPLKNDGVVRRVNGGDKRKSQRVIDAIEAPRGCAGPHGRPRPVPGGPPTKQRRGDRGQAGLGGPAGGGEVGGRASAGAVREETRHRIPGAARPVTSNSGASKIRPPLSSKSMCVNRQHRHRPERPFRSAQAFGLGGTAREGEVLALKGPFTPWGSRPE